MEPMVKMAETGLMVMMEPKVRTDKTVGVPMRSPLLMVLKERKKNGSILLKVVMVPMEPLDETGLMERTE